MDQHVVQVVLQQNLGKVHQIILVKVVLPNVLNVMVRIQTIVLLVKVDIIFSLIYIVAKQIVHLDIIKLQISLVKDAISYAKFVMVQLTMIV